MEEQQDLGKQMSPKKTIFNDLDLNCLGDNRIGLRLTFDLEAEGMTSKEGVDMANLAGLVKDQVGDVFGAVLVLKMLAQWRGILPDFRRSRSIWDVELSDQKKGCLINCL